jgi:hypothetical protein
MQGYAILSKPIKTFIRSKFFLDCLSGEASCDIQPVCFVPGECDGNMIRAIEQVPER